MVRLIALIVAVPSLLVGGFGLTRHFAANAAILPELERAMLVVLSWFWLDGLTEQLTALVPAAIATAFGLVFLAFAAWPRGGVKDVEKELRRKDKDRERTARSDAKQAERDAGVPSRLRRKAEKRAASMARKGHLSDAAELCRQSGAPDAAVKYYVEDGDIKRAAEVLTDENRFDEAADLYLRAEAFDSAASLFAARNEYEKAGDCYRKGGRMSVAAEMYEKAGRYLLAGECYMRCEFHRHAAESFLKVQDWDRAAKALDKAINEETAGGAMLDGKSGAELRKLVIRAGHLYDQGGHFDKAAAILERGECWAEAGEIAMRNKLYERASEYFRRADDIPRAAHALKEMGEDQAAAQMLGEFHRDKGSTEEAAELLLQAGDFGAAGDLYRLMEDYLQAGECFERGGDAASAAEMFRLSTAWDRAAANYARMGHYQEAADCIAETGDLRRQAELLTKGDHHLAAGRVWVKAKDYDAAITVLQQTPAEHGDFRKASALLGEIFRAKGKYTLAAKKLRQAIGQSELDSTNIDLYYKLATVYESANDARSAAELYDRILAADYHYKDVEERLESVRSLAAAQSDAGMGTGEGVSDSLTPSGRPGRYQIQGELGRGGMGIVYKANDAVLDRAVAFKVLPDALRDNPQALKNFLREAKSAAKLNHPNIVTVYDAGEQDGRYYIAMEYVDGTTLKEIVRKKGAIAAKGVVHVLLQMCEALQYAHDQKVVHRDIKTANTMWTRDKKAKIMDFGLAKVVEEVRNHTTLVSGTPYYMSPEQTLGKNIDHRTDLYSLGVTLFELVTGKLPFVEGNVPYHHVHTAPPDPRELHAGVPAFLAEAVNACLQKDPAARPQTARDIAGMVRRGMGQEG